MEAAELRGQVPQIHPWCENMARSLMVEVCSFTQLSLCGRLFHFLTLHEGYASKDQPSLTPHMAGRYPNADVESAAEDAA